MKWWCNPTGATPRQQAGCSALLLPHSSHSSTYSKAIPKHLFKPHCPVSQTCALKRSPEGAGAEVWG